MDTLSSVVINDTTTIHNATPEGLESAGVAPAAILAAVKAQLAVEVDAQAERLRQSVMTPGSGQAMEYQEAQSQAAAALKASASATADKYPMLAASIGIDVDPSTGAPATDVVGVARAVDAARSAWLDFGVAIRKARLRGKAAIEAAASVEDAKTAAEAIEWPTAG